MVKRQTMRVPLADAFLAWAPYRAIQENPYLASEE